MSDTQDAVTGIPSTRITTSKHSEEIRNDLVRDLIDLKSPTVDTVTKNELEIPKDQDKAIASVSKNEMKNQENGAEKELFNRRLGIRSRQEKIIDGIHHKTGLEAPEEEAITIDSPSDAQKMATSEDMDENANSNREDARMEFEKEEANPLTDCNTESMASKDEVSQKAPLLINTDERNSNSESCSKATVVERLEENAERSISPNSSSESLAKEVPPKEPDTDDKNSSSESDLDATNEEMVGTNAIPTSGPVSDNNADSLAKRDEVLQNTQIKDDCINKLVPNSDRGLKISTETVEVIKKLISSSITDSDEPAANDVGQNMQFPDYTDEQTQNSDSSLKPSVAVEANSKIASGLLESEKTSNKKYDKVPKSTQFPDVREDYSDSDSERNSKKTAEKMVGTSSEDSDVDTSTEETSPEQKYLSAKRVGKPSARITEMIAQRLNSEEFTRKLKEIDAMIKHLTNPEFLSPEERSLEEFEALEEIYNRQAFFEANFAAFSEISESIALKRKSKLSDVDEDTEECQVMPKKYKFSMDLDGRPFRTQSTENSCRSEEQFRLAYEEVNDSQRSQREKEYKFPVTSGNGDYLKEKLKICKHNFTKIGEMVVNAMSLDDYIPQKENIMDGRDYESKRSGDGNKNISHVFPKSGMSVDEFLEYGRGQMRDLRSAKQSSSSAGTTISNDFPRKRRYFHYRGSVQSLKEEMDEKESANCGYFGFGGAFDSVKKLFLFATFTGSLLIAITMAKVFGVTFPVPIHQEDHSRKNSNKFTECDEYLDKYYPL